MSASDLLELTARLVAMPSVSREEQAITDWLERELRALPSYEVFRLGDNLVARTHLGRATRVVLAGHSDTVPPNGNAGALLDGDRLWGVGAADMKGGLAVMVHLARAVPDPAVDVTYVFYAREEVAAAESGLAELFDACPDLVDGDLAILGEPTGGVLEAGCQGTMRVRVELRGARAHTARPWMGRNALHRLGRLLAAVADYEPRQPELEGCRFHEALQAVRVEGGVAGNVVPDRAEVVLNHRFAPDRTPAAAEDHLRRFLAPFLDDGDAFEVLDVAPPAPPALDHPLVQSLVARHHLAVRAKLGWTDVARFAAHGIPAVNLGPGDAEVAHTAGEYVTADQLAVVADALGSVVRGER